MKGKEKKERMKYHYEQYCLILWQYGRSMYNADGVIINFQNFAKSGKEKKKFFF